MEYYGYQKPCKGCGILVPCSPQNKKGVRCATCKHKQRLKSSADYRARNPNLAELKRRAAKEDKTVTELRQEIEDAEREESFAKVFVRPEIDISPEFIKLMVRI